MTHRASIHGPAATLAALLLALLAAPAVPAQDGTPLDSGVIVDGAAATVYVADESGRVTALATDTGRPRWSGPARGLPLARMGNVLLVMSEPAASGQLSLSTVDAVDGEVLHGFVGELPPAVVANPIPLPSQHFEIRAYPEGGALRLQWRYQRWPLRGALLATSGQGPDAPIELEGAVRVDVGAGEVSVLDSQPALMRADLAAAERVPGVEGIQFRSADDRYAQTAQPETDPVFGMRWHWTLHERGSGRAVAQVDLPVATAPHLLLGNLLLWRAGPMLVRGTPEQVTDHPERLVAIDVTSGEERWSFPVLDREFRGAPPP